MKSLKSIALVSALTTPLAFSATSISDLVESPADILTEQPLELSDVDTSTGFPSQKARRIPKRKKATVEVPLAEQPLAVMRTASVMTMSAPSHQINCAVAYNLNENVVYSDAIATVGEQHCYIMPLSQQSKVVGQLLAADSSSDFNLYLYEYDPAMGVLNVLDGGEVPAGLTEVAYAVTGQPSYILVAELMSGVGGSINFLGNSYSNYDAYEPNDDTFTPVSVGQSITGNLDNPADLDYFSYQLSSSETEFKVYITGSPEHQIEFYNAGAWQVLPHDQQLTVNGSAGATYYMRALAAPNEATSALNNYQIRTSYPVDHFSDIDLWSSDNVTELAVSGVTEAHSHLGLGGVIVDSSGNPVVGETIVMQVPADGEWHVETAVTNSVGSFSASFELPDCRGANTVQKWSNYGYPATLWEIDYDLWDQEDARIIMYPLSQQSDSDRAEVQLKYAHICKERVIGSR